MTDIGIVLIGGLIGFLILGVPIAFTLGILAFIGILMADVNPLILAQRMIGGTTLPSLLAIPGFILVGELMGAGGLSKRLVRLASTLFGHLTGGLSMTTVVAATFFGAITGSAPATTAAMGSVMIGELEQRGYTRRYGAALCASVGPLGQMIPPSIPMIIWGVLAEESIAKLFLAGVIPGLLAASGFLVVSVRYARAHGVPREARASLGDVARATRDGIWALLAPLVILGGIYGGVFTPTEAGVVGALYSLVIGLFVYRGFTVKQLPGLVLNAMRMSVMVMFIIAMAYAFAWVLAREQIPDNITASLLSLTSNPIILLLMINGILLILGAIMDTVSAMVILSGVLVGLGAQIGVDPIQLGAMVVINFAVGMVTPPVGYSIFVASSVSGLRIEEIARELTPFLVVLIAVVLLVAFVPALTLWLPNLVG